ncbi:A24 family peptidase [Streptomyces sp. SID14515]|uniref:prepilin peptidase n=1 Tax=Streptomyces sp. SID14515 TaxID=2706074 RepID=UPI0013C6AD65|nr:prepilin peptidase [Streptomyces sp. SID14515]
MDAALLAVAAVWGAVTGLLIPRAAYRFAVEPEEPWRTACPAGHPLTGPVRGWLGPARCAPCAAPGPPAAPEDDTAAETPAPGAPPGYAPGVLAPLATVVACVALAAATGARPELIGWLALAPVAVLLAVVDRRVHRLPDPLTLPLAAAAVLLLGGAALLPGHAGSWTSGLLGGLALGGFYFLLFLINPNGMGFGDVKLALALGVALGWYGWAVLFLGGFAGFLFGAAYGLGLVLLRRAGRRTGIPFGPFMIAGALTGLLLGALAA